MAKIKNTAFVRLDILENWRFWNQYAVKGDFEGAGREVIAQANALLAEDSETNHRAAQLLEESKEFQAKKIEAGRKGGQAKARNAKAAAEQAQQQTTPETTNKPNHQNRRKRPPTKEDVYNFAHDHSLDEVDARDWYERNFVERPGCDENGEVIRNWPGALIRSCQAAKKKRENK